MAGKSEQKSQKERQKEARTEKHKLRFLSWVEHQGGKKKKPAMPAVGPGPVEEKKPKKEPDGVKKKKRKREAEGKRKPKSNFQEYLEMEMGGAVSMEEDLEMERKLAKKLKVKKGKLGGPDDGMDELFADLGFGGDFGSDDDETKAYDWNVVGDTNLDKREGKKKNKAAKKDDTEMEEPDDIGEENGQKKKKNKKMKKAGMETEEVDDVGEENGRKRKKKKTEDDSEMNEPDDGSVDIDEENDGAVLESEGGEPNVVD